MGKCGFCGREVDLPFTCKYCEMKLCPEHRLPESHNCKNREKVRTSRQSSVPLKLKVGFIDRITMIRVSKAEITHLLAGLAVFFVVEASRFAPFSFEAMLVPFLATVFAFGVHEFSHKYAAQSFGFWSEFRVDPVMAIASLLTSLTRFKVIAPGSVLIRGYSVKRSHMGVIAFAGPAMNVLLAFAFKIVSYFLPIALQVALVNADIAFFNLLPGGFFDGKKIFDWDKRAWIGLFAASAALWLFIVLVP